MKQNTRQRDFFGIAGDIVILIFMIAVILGIASMVLNVIGSLLVTAIQYLTFETLFYLFFGIGAYYFLQSIRYEYKRKRESYKIYENMNDFELRKEAFKDIIDSEVSDKENKNDDIEIERQIE